LRAGGINFSAQTVQVNGKLKIDTSTSTSSRIDNGTLEVLGDLHIQSNGGGGTAEVVLGNLGSTQNITCTNPPASPGVPTALAPSLRIKGSTNPSSALRLVNVKCQLWVGGELSIETGAKIVSQTLPNDRFVLNCRSPRFGSQCPIRFPMTYSSHNAESTMGHVELAPESWAPSQAFTFPENTGNNIVFDSLTLNNGSSSGPRDYTKPADTHVRGDLTVIGSWQGSWALILTDSAVNLGDNTKFAFQPNSSNVAASIPSGPIFINRSPTWVGGLQNGPPKAVEVLGHALIPASTPASDLTVFSGQLWVGDNVVGQASSLIFQGSNLLDLRGASSPQPGNGRIACEGSGNGRSIRWSNGNTHFLPPPLLNGSDSIFSGSFLRLFGCSFGAGF
jgi:hypothetical protein